MSRAGVRILLFLLLITGAVQAQDLTGNWQGTLKAGRDLRIVIKIANDDKRLQATMYSIDQPGPGFKASGVRFEAGTRTADAHTFFVEVTDGRLDIRLIPNVGFADPVINALRVTHRTDR